MKVYRIVSITIFATLICFLRGQQLPKKHPMKFNRIFANISQECLVENRVTTERVVGVYTLSTNDREAKCYVACMLTRFNVTDESGNYNDKALERLMAKSKTHEVSPSMKSVVEKCEKEDDSDRCEKAVKFTRCIYNHRNEMGISNNTTAINRRKPTMPFGPGRRPGQRQKP